MSFERRFNPIDLQPDVAVGIKLPFVSKSGVLFDLSYSTEEQAISNLKNLLLTRQGERIMQPLFGTTIQDSLFEQNTEDLQTAIKDSITEAIDFWLPYITINRLTVKNVISVLGQSEEQGVQISISVSVNGQPVNTPVTFLATLNDIELL
jgi:phage baseplate assembly protein W